MNCIIINCLCLDVKKNKKKVKDFNKKDMLGIDMDVFVDSLVSL